MIPPPDARSVVVGVRIVHGIPEEVERQIRELLERWPEAGEPRGVWRLAAIHFQPALDGLDVAELYVTMIQELWT